MTSIAGDERPEPSVDELLRTVRSRPRGDRERDAAFAALVARYSWIVWACVRRYRGCPEPEDVMQAGYVGLVKAISYFDPAVGGSLGAYAQPCVSGEIKRYFRDTRWQLRVHRQFQELRLAIRAADGELTQQLGRVPGDSDTAAYLDVPEADVAAAHAASQVFQIGSLDIPVGAGEDTSLIGELIGEEDPRLEQAIALTSVWQHCAELPRREQRMLMMRFYGNMSQAQIAEQFGISQMHVSRLLDHALAYLRQQITDSGRPA